MSRIRIHQPPPQAIVAELVRAGVSPETATAMERWKAQEVLELLRHSLDGGPSLVPGGKGLPEAW